MAALSAKRYTKSRNLGVRRVYPLKASEAVYQGGMVMIGSDGYALSAKAGASNKGVVGVAIASATGGSGDGDVSVTVQEGEFLFAGDTLTAASNGDKVYADDDQTIDETQATNCPIAGICTEYVSASSAWVLVGLAAIR